jgi:hypothetical protein
MGTIIEHIENWKRNIFVFSAILGILMGLTHWLFVLVYVWLALYSITNYFKLTQRRCFKFGVVVEVSVMYFLFTFFLFPEKLLLWLAGVVLLAANLVLVMFYWYYEKKISR